MTANVADRRTVLLGAAACLALPACAWAGEAPRRATMYKDPHCGCCTGHAEHLRQHGYAVEVIESADLSAIRRRHGVPAPLEGCHTTLVGGYAVEGHVPAPAIDRLLAERPQIRGISLPGMPAGSPGMDGPKAEPFVIYEFSGGPVRVFSVE